jgi:hypothetical protein
MFVMEDFPSYFQHFLGADAEGFLLGAVFTRTEERLLAAPLWGKRGETG